MGILDKPVDKFELLKSTARETQIIIDVLDWNTENKIGEVTGDVISGSISIDGKSTVRRTASLTINLTDENYKLQDPLNILSVNKKIRIYIGVNDLEDPKNGIQWFNMGIFILTKPSVTINSSSSQVSITAQDKMCLHNGEVGGVLEFTTRFDTELVTSNNYAEWDAIKNAITAQNTTNLKAACRTFINNIGDNNEQLTQIAYNILQIADSEDWTAIEKLFTPIGINYQENKVMIKDIIKYVAIELAGEKPGRVIVDVPEYVRTPIIIPKNTPYTMNGTSGVTTEEKVGYRFIRYVYPNELKKSTGATLTSIYDDCKNMLGGNYEYFYDIEGNFHFQEIRNYTYTTEVTDILTLTTKDYKRNYNNSAVIFDFSDTNIITAFQNNFSWSSIKNDFYVWGETNEADYGYHVVIDDKPVILPEYAYNIDWRVFLCLTYGLGSTGKYTLCGIGAPTAEQKAKCPENGVYYDPVDTETYHKGKTSEPVFVYKSVNTGEMVNGKTWYGEPTSFELSAIQPDYYEELVSIWKNNYYDIYWNKLEGDAYNPTYAFDVISNDSELSKFSVKNIGRRVSATTSKDIKGLYTNKVEDYVVYYGGQDTDDIIKYYMDNQAHQIHVETYEQALAFKPYTNIYNSCFDTMKQQIFAKTSYNEQITITSLPFFYLEPNNRVYAYFRKASINGYFILDKITFNFDANPLMTSNLTKVTVIDG